MPPKIALIAALSTNHVIGKNNSLPWSLPLDWENFRQVTAGQAFIMGRLSHESPHALHSDYKNIILSRRDQLALPEDFIHARQVEEALAAVSAESLVFVLGGAAVFEAFMPHADLLYLTHVHAVVEGDAYFPAIHWPDWQVREQRFYSRDERHAYDFSINVYRRKNIF